MPRLERTWHPQPAPQPAVSMQQIAGQDRRPGQARLPIVLLRSMLWMGGKRRRPRSLQTICRRYIQFAGSSKVPPEVPASSSGGDASSSSSSSRQQRQHRQRAPQLTTPRHSRQKRARGSSSRVGSKVGKGGSDMGRESSSSAGGRARGGGSGSGAGGIHAAGSRGNGAGSLAEIVIALTGGRSVDTVTVRSQTQSDEQQARWLSVPVTSCRPMSYFDEQAMLILRNWDIEMGKDTRDSGGATESLMAHAFRTGLILGMSFESLMATTYLDPFMRVMLRSSARGPAANHALMRQSLLQAAASRRRRAMSSLAREAAARVADHMRADHMAKVLDEQRRRKRAQRPR